MRFWITKNSALPVREQLVRQVLLGILSEDLPPGRKVPSVRALARRCRIHANTVSAAYHELLARGWLELRRGSGLYVRAQSATPDGIRELDVLLTELLAAAHAHGHEPEDVLRQLEHRVRPKIYQRIVIMEPEAAMASILEAEIVEALPGIGVEAWRPGAEEWDGALVVALGSRAAGVQAALPGVPCVPLRLRSVPSSLEGQSRPGPDTLVCIASGSREIRFWAHAMLIAVGLDADALTEIDATVDGWQQRIPPGALVVTDVVTERRLPGALQPRVFRVIADQSLAELRQFCRPVL